MSLVAHCKHIQGLIWSQERSSEKAYEITYKSVGFARVNALALSWLVYLSRLNMGL